MIPISTPTGTRRPKGWVVISLSGMLLGLAQNQIRQIVPASALQPAPAGSTEAAIHIRDGDSWPVYALDAELRLAAKGDQRFAVFLEALHHPLGLLADAVRVLPEDEDLRVQPLPGCMAGADSPLTGLALLDGSEAVLVSDAQGMACLLQAGLIGEVA
ncbi:MAG: hypothetical protein A2286_12980 [Gammaproteobacteria bacterium RIFOXYA12_FULL_61_12]|nr:MAG: hypothetical protein A2286_12980 [Gammaproteobacteria bacterium RIFOXYA12_FULL_61_12]